MKRWSLLAVFIFMALLAIPLWGLPMAGIFAWIYCHYLDNNK